MKQHNKAMAMTDRINYEQSKSSYTSLTDIKPIEKQSYTKLAQLDTPASLYSVTQ